MKKYTMTIVNVSRNILYTKYHYDKDKQEKTLKTYEELISEYNERLDKNLTIEYLNQFDTTQLGICEHCGEIVEKWVDYNGEKFLQKTEEEIKAYTDIVECDNDCINEYKVKYKSVCHKCYNKLKIENETNIPKPIQITIWDL